MKPQFLTLDEVLAIHSDQIRRYGGADGIRDLALLQSAIATPGVTFDGNLLHTSLSEMAAAYLFHITRHHPFLDGNKRTGLAAALVFLRLNGESIRASEDDLVNLVIGGAAGKVAKPELAVFIASHRAKR